MFHFIIISSIPKKLVYYGKPFSIFYLSFNMSHYELFYFWGELGTIKNCIGKIYLFYIFLGKKWLIIIHLLNDVSKSVIGLFVVFGIRSLARVLLLILITIFFISCWVFFLLISFFFSLFLSCFPKANNVTFNSFLVYFYSIIRSIFIYLIK